MSNEGAPISRQQLALPRPYVAPRDDTEAALAEIWCAALDTDRIGVEDDFTDLGGDSLDAETIMMMIEQELGVHVPITILASASTIAALAREVTPLRSARQ